MSKRKKQINFTLPDELHQEIKVRAARRNISMNLWIVRAIHAAIRREDRKDIT